MEANEMPASAIPLAAVYQARARLAGRVRQTPLVLSDFLTDRLGTPVHLKLEHHQVTGSFKLRGATNAVLALDEAAKARGVVAVSTGNHGRALAHAARAAGVRCTICMSSLVPGNKVEAIRRLGADVRIIGRSQDEAQLEVDRLVAQEGATMLPPFDHPDIIAGQATLGLELVEELPELETVLVPLSGGGLITGIALAIKALLPEARIVGITMERGAAMHASQAAGRPVQVREEDSLADSLGGGIGLDNRYTFAMVRDLVDDLQLVTEEQIAEGVRHAYVEERQVIEGAAAVGIAALLAGRIDRPGRTVAILSGCNIDMGLHRRIIAGDMPA
jgi:threonine dehydratase